MDDLDSFGQFWTVLKLLTALDALWVLRMGRHFFLSRYVTVRSLSSAAKFLGSKLFWECVLQRKQWESHDLDSFAVIWICYDLGSFGQFWSPFLGIL